MNSNKLIQIMRYVFVFVLSCLFVLFVHVRFWNYKEGPTCQMLTNLRTYGLVNSVWPNYKEKHIFANIIDISLNLFLL